MGVFISLRSTIRPPAGLAPLLAALLNLTACDVDLDDGTTTGTHSLQTSSLESTAGTLDSTEWVNPCPQSDNFNCKQPLAPELANALAGIDAQGCPRKSCQTDKECSVGQRCYRPYLFGKFHPTQTWWEPDPQQPELCSCRSTSDIYGGYCVASEDYPKTIPPEACMQALVRGPGECDLLPPVASPNEEPWACRAQDAATWILEEPTSCTEHSFTTFCAASYAVDVNCEELTPGDVPQCPEFSGYPANYLATPFGMAMLASTCESFREVWGAKSCWSGESDEPATCQCPCFEQP